MPDNGISSLDKKAILYSPYNRVYIFRLFGHRKIFSPPLTLVKTLESAMPQMFE
jgi:hypothetical protein